MEPYEIRALMEYGWYASIDGWQQARMIAYISAQTHSKKRLKVTDIIKLPCDGARERGTTEMSNADARRLRRKAEMIEKRFAKGEDNKGEKQQTTT